MKYPPGSFGSSPILTNSSSLSFAIGSAFDLTMRGISPIITSTGVPAMLFSTGTMVTYMGIAYVKSLCLHSIGVMFLFILPSTSLICGSPSLNPFIISLYPGIDVSITGSSIIISFKVLSKNVLYDSMWCFVIPFSFIKASIIAHLSSAEIIFDSG